MKILVIGGFDRSLLNFRGPLLRAMVEAGYEVVAAAPPENPEVPAQLSDLGVRFVAVPSLRRTGLNPWQDLRLRRALKQMLRRELPEVLLAYTIKPVVHGLPAARRAGVPRCYALITGLGAAFNTPGIKGHILSAIASSLYRRALRHADRVITQNEEIGRFLVSRRLVSSASCVAVVAGSGVDTDHFAAVPIPSGPPVFLLLARMLRDKGIIEYVEAAKRCRQRLPSARFLLVGDTDPNPTAIPAEMLAEWNDTGAVEYRPGVKDVRPLLRQCSTYVLPSYHEGMPRSVLEAMAIGRPVITTDTIGCRETIKGAGMPDADGIRSGENGLLVPVKSVNALAMAMERLANDRARAMVMGHSGRLIAERYFDVRCVNESMLQRMDLTAARPSQSGYGVM